MRRIDYRLFGPIYVKLTESGRVYLEKYYSDMRNRAGINPDSCRVPQPVDGWYKYQLPEMLFIFGAGCRNADKPLFERTIQFEVEE